jgi:hypothetical protein
MYRSAVILIVAFVLLLLMLIVVAQTVVVVEMLAVVDERAGTVQVVRGGDSRPAEIGTLARAGERIRTGAGARVGLHWADGSRVELGPDSEFVIQRCRLNKAKHTRRSSFRLNLGEIWIRVRGSLEPGSKFEVETPTIVAAVRGTMFNVKVASDGTTQLQVYRGEVEISRSGATRDVQSGGCAVVGRRGFDLRGMSEAEKQSWQEVADITGPLLEVLEPAAGASTSMPLAPVRGRTEDAVAVAVNGERVRVGPKGTFRGRARLVEGQNVVTIVATLGNLTTSVQREVTYVNPTREIVATSRPSVNHRDAPGVRDVIAVLRDDAGKLVPDGTPVEVTAEAGAVERYHRTQRGVVTAEWRPEGAHGEVRVTARSGGVTATVVIATNATAPAP